MAAHRKKIVAFLAAVAFSSVVAVCPAQSTAPGLTQFRELLAGSHPLGMGSLHNWNPPEGVLRTLKTPFVAFGRAAKDPNSLIGQGNSKGTKELFFKMMVSVLLVVGLGAAAVYASKRLLPKITALSGKKIKVIETVYIGPRKAVHLLKIDNQCLLIGSTNETITKLADITTEATDAPADLSPAYIENN